VRTHFGGLFFALAVAGAAVPAWPWWLPWLLYDQNLPPVGTWPPNLLVVALQAPASPSDGTAIAALEVLGAEAVIYADLAPEPEVGSLLTLPDGSLLAAHLYAAGYATAAIAGVPEGLRGLGIAEIDAGPGDRRLLEESAAWMGGSLLLSGSGSGLLAFLGNDRSLWGAEQLGAEAARWILDWRTTRAPAPFFLLVDFRTSEPDVDALDGGLRRVLDRLWELQLGSATLLVLAVESRGSDASSPLLRALIVPPLTWSRAKERNVAAQVWGRALSQALLEIAANDGTNPVRLPGLREELVPREAR
jgi:hypothetical protein